MNEEEKNVKKSHRKMDKGQVFVKVMAGILALLMVAGTGVSVIFSII